MAARHVATRQIVFWIASIIFILLLTFHIIAFTHVIQYRPNDLGLLTKLPITFWISLAYLVALLYLGRKSGRLTIIVAVLISFYLFAIPTLIVDNKADAISHFWSSVGEQLVSKGHINFEALQSYDLQNWPGYFFLTAFLTSSTGLSAATFASYFPLLTIALLGSITYFILRLRLSNLHSSFGVLWVIGSLFTGQQYFMPQSIALLLYFAIFLLVAKLFFNRNQRNIEISLTIMLLFTAMVTIHLLTSALILIAIVALYVISKIFLRKARGLLFSIVICLLMITIFSAYNFLIIQDNFSEIIRILYTQILERQTTLSNVALTASGSRFFGSESYMLQVLSSYTVTLLSVVVAAAAILTVAIGLLRNKKEARFDLFWIPWIIAAALLGLSVVYGPEALLRAFMFSLMPISYFAIRFLRKKPGFLILVLAALVFINIPAQYGNRNYTYVPSTELKGAAFFTNYAPSNESFFYEYLTPIGRHDTGVQLNLEYLDYLPINERINECVANSKLVISSNMERNLYEYFYGTNLLKNLSLADHLDRVYDNEGFQIYAR